MATYNNTYANSIKINPATPNIRGISDNYSNDGQVNQGGYGLGDIFQLDYDRNKIEQIFNQGTDAQYDLMKKENQIAQNQYANNQFAQQQSAIETLRQQRNEQISSGMARGLNAAQEQGTILGLQQEGMSGALELANQQQTQADKIAAEYASNVAKALQEANAVKEAMANVSAQMYEADMLGYTGELSAAAQMDANAVNKYLGDIGLEGTKYTADKNLEAAIETALRNLEGTKYAADLNLEGTRYNADKNLEAAIETALKNLEGTKYTANMNLEGTKYAADRSLEGAQAQAAATRAAAALSRASGGGGSGQSTEKVMDALEQAATQMLSNNPNLKGDSLITAMTKYLMGNDPSSYANMDYNTLKSYVKEYVNNYQGGAYKAQIIANNPSSSLISQRKTSSLSAPMQNVINNANKIDGPLKPITGGSTYLGTMFGIPISHTP